MLLHNLGNMKVSGQLHLPTFYPGERSRDNHSKRAWVDTRADGRFKEELNLVTLWETETRFLCFLAHSLTTLSVFQSHSLAIDSNDGTFCYEVYCFDMAAGMASSVQRFVNSWMIWVSNLLESQLPSLRPERPRDRPSLLYKGYRVSFPGVRQSRRGVD